MSGNNTGRAPRTVAVVGPYGSGKTTLLESILTITGAVQRKGSVTQKNSVGDASPEARARQMSVEVNCATTRYMDQNFTFLDCPGSIEFLQDTLNVLPGVDAAVVVCEPEPAKLQMLQPYLKRLSDLRIPHFLFVNKIDKASGSLRASADDAAGRERHAASAAPDSDLGEQCGDGLCRSGAGAAPTSTARTMRAR